MALTLQDFNRPAKDDVVQLADLQPKGKPSPAANSDTVNNIAVFGAALATDDTVENTYQSISRQLSFSTSSATLDQILGKWETNDMAGMTEALKETLADPAVTDQQKTDLMYGWMSGMNKTSLSYKVGMSAVVDDDPGENPEQEALRIAIGKGYQEVDDYAAWSQQTINALNSEADPNLATNVQSLALSIVPFLDPADQVIFENRLNAGEGGVPNAVGTMLLLGSNRERLRTAFLRMPIEQRKPIIDNFIKVIRASKGPQGDPTMLRQIQALERMIIPGAYGNTDKWVDDVFSVLDATVLLTPLKGAARGLGGLFKGGRAAVEAGDAARVAEETIARSERLLEPLPRSQSLVVVPEDPVIAVTSNIADIDNVIDSLPIEPTSGDITQLRTLIMSELDNPAGFSIDNVIDNARITDNLTGQQILDLRGNIGIIRDKRTAFLNGGVPDLPIADRVNLVLDNLPVEGTKAEIDELRGLITSGALVDDVVDNATIVDKMTAAQIEELRNNVGAIKASTPSIANVRAQQISSNVQPRSLASTYRNTNVTKTKAAHAMIIADPTDGAAKMLAGTSKQDALAHDFLPEIGIDGRISNKVEFDESLAQPIESITKHINKSEGTSWMDAAERAAAEARINEDFKNTMGITNRSAMASVSNVGPSINSTDVGVSLKQVYGPKDGGFSDAYIAIDTVRAALAKYGVKDKDITLLSRQADGNYAPHTKGDLRNGNFLVQVDYQYRYSPKDAKFTGYDVGKLLKFIRVPDAGKFFDKDGGLVQQLVPKSLNIDPRAYVPGVAAADRSSGIQKQFLNSAKEFTTKFNKLSSEQQVRADDYIRLANEQEIKFSMAGLRARGMSDDTIEALAHWKRLQDTLYVLENQDIARGLRDRGFELFEHRPSNTKLLTSRVGRSGAPNKVYDVGTGTFVEMTNRQLDELYDAGGHIAKLRNKEGDIEHVISRNTPDGGWSRMVRDDDTILNYRDGYYHVKYNDPYYIVHTAKDGTKKTIARAASSRDARLEADRLNATSTDGEYFFRRDKSLDPFDEHMDVATNAGRSAQKIRGKRLERVKGSSDKTLTDHGVESPLDSLVRSIASISHRVSYRNVIDAEKRRWMSQWNKLTTKPGMFPDSIDAIQNMPGATEARHAFRHIEQLESGYGNMIDDASKAFFSAMSQGAGRLGWDWLDKGASKLASIDPTKVGRLTAFKLSLASNPIRQLPLQIAPGLVIVSSLGPQYWPKIVKQLGIMGAWHRGVDLTTIEKVGKYGLDMKETQRMLEDYELSGLSNAVNAHSFLQDDAARLADRNIAQRTASIAGKPLKIAQSVGFDLGEQGLMSMVYAMEWNRLNDLVKGRAITASEREALVAKVRALTGDMNRGGDMPYNSNSLSVVMQFLQAPHKMATGLIIGHRGLTKSERLRLAAGYSVAFGLPGIPLIEGFVDKYLPAEMVEEREIIKGGLANAMLNSWLSTISGEKVGIDVSDSLQPITFEPMIEFVGELINGNFSELVGGSAAVSLVADDNGRIRKFVRAVTNWATPGNYENIDEVKQIGITAMEMFSGTSNLWKSMLISKAGQIKTATGQVVDEDVSYWDTMGKAAGFQTIDEARYWEGNMAKWEIDDKIDGDIEIVMDRYFGMLTREGTDVAELESMTKVMKYISIMYADNPQLQEKASDYFKMKLRQNPQALNKLQDPSAAGLYSDEQLNTILSRGNLTKEQIEQIKEWRTIGVEAYGS